MTHSADVSIPLRALADVRRRDVPGYLGLRYYLNASASATNNWALRVAVDQVSARRQAQYSHVSAFKEFDQNGNVVSRTISVPDPVEMLAETSLLAVCARREKSFRLPPSVYAYALAERTTVSGAFEPYWDGLRRRQTDVANACAVFDGGVATHLDIRKFYPGITSDRATAAWVRAADMAELPHHFKALGSRLLEFHQHAGGQGGSASGLLTGPSFSHLVANLIMREVDDAYAGSEKVRYFRYVDDITLVGQADDVAAARGQLELFIDRLGLQLHPEDSAKTLTVSCKNWLVAAHDLDETEISKNWARLVGRSRALMLLGGQEAERWKSVQAQHEMRLPLYDHLATARDGRYAAALLVRLERWARIRREVFTGGARKLLEIAIQTRYQMRSDFEEAVRRCVDADSFGRKRSVTKLRFLCARLTYLGSRTMLGQLSSSIDHIPELAFHREVMRAIATCDVTEVMRMGQNVVQAVAQPLAAEGGRVRVSAAVPRDRLMDGLAILAAYNIRVDVAAGVCDGSQSSLVRLMQEGSNRELMRDSETRVRTLACLHGVGPARHVATLRSVFDEAEDEVLDAIHGLGDSGYL